MVEGQEISSLPLPVIKEYSHRLFLFFLVCHLGYKVSGKAGESNLLLNVSMVTLVLQQLKLAPLPCEAVTGIFGVNKLIGSMMLQATLEEKRIFYKEKTVQVHNYASCHPLLELLSCR